MTARNGFTFLEIMIGMAILAIGLMATSSAMFTAINAKDSTAGRDLALQAIESTLEDVLYNNFATIADFVGTPQEYEVVGLDVHPDDTRTEVLVMTVEEVNGDPDILRITLEAAWRHRESREHMSIIYIHTNRGGRG